LVYFYNFYINNNNIEKIIKDLYFCKADILYLEINNEDIEIINEKGNTFFYILSNWGSSDIA